MARRYSFDISDFHELEPLKSIAVERTAYHNEALSDSPSSTLKHAGRGYGRRRKWEWQETAHRWWTYETLGAVFSLACFSALVAVLRRSDGKEQTRWLFNKLTLNGLVALLATFIRASMMLGVGAGLSQMKWNRFSSSPDLREPRPRKLEELDDFDQASRGPSGSFMLLFGLRKPHLGLIGALITIFTLAFDVFSQEVIIIRSGMVSNANGTIAGEVLTIVGEVVRSEWYDSYTKIIQETNFANDLSTVAAINNGIFNYQTTTAPRPDCSTGNCTWPIVPSLAVCGSCTNLTTSLTSTCQEYTEDQTYSVEICNYTLSDGQANAYTFSTVPGGYDPSSSGALAYAVVGGYATQQYNQSDIAYLDTWLMVDAGMRGSVQVHACGLWFCVQTYETTVYNGFLMQNSTGNWSETNVAQLFSGTTSTWWANFTDVPQDIAQNASYAVGEGVMIAFGQNPMISDGNVTFGLDASSFYDYSSTAIEGLSNIVDYDAWIDKFALGLSNNVRATGNTTQPASMYAGQALTSVPFVHVRWAWLTFPAGMVLASLLFLAACIWQTAHLHVHVWKSDALALLFASVEESRPRDVADRRRIGDERFWLEAVRGAAVFRKPAGDNT